MNFSVGMATFDDPRVPFVVMDLMIHHPLATDIIVVDNNPGSEVATATRNFCNGCGPRVRYIAMDQPKGTSPPRNRVIQEAKNEWAICLDAHVILHTGSLERLDRSIKKLGSNSPDLIHGPMYTESNNLFGCLMNDQWRSDMWGTWGRAWQTASGERFSAQETDQTEPPSGPSFVRYRPFDKFKASGRQADFVTGPELGLPAQLGWPGHESVLRGLGCAELTDNEDGDPFVIPGFGMGLFATRKDFWLGFHPKARMFGGEEMTIHCKYRQAGRKVWCVPGLKWWHHFYRPVQPYAAPHYAVVRNLVLNFQDLGYPLDDIYAHFVMPRRRLPQAEWDQVLAGLEWPLPTPGTNGYHNPPAGYDLPTVQQGVPEYRPDNRKVFGQDNEPRALSVVNRVPSGVLTVSEPMATSLDLMTAKKDCGCGANAALLNQSPEAQQVVKFTTESTIQSAPVRRGGCAATGETATQVCARSLIPELAKRVAENGDISEHLETLKGLAKGKRVVEMGTRNAVATTAFLAGEPASVHTYDLSPGPWAKTLTHFASGMDYQVITGDSTQVDIEMCDILFLDTDPHTADRIYLELTRHHGKVSHLILIHDTVTFGNEYAGQPGLLPGIRRFLHENPEWTSVRHDLNNNGLMFLSRLDSDKQQPPGMIRQALNFGKALYKHVAGGLVPTPEIERERRLELCVLCPKRWHDTCGACGCPIEKKAGFLSEACPIGKWSADEVDGVVQLSAAD